MSIEQFTPDKFLSDQYVIDRYLTWPWSLLLASVAIGFLTMTFLESLKANNRYQFSQRELNEWLHGHYGRPRQNMHRFILAIRQWSIKRPLLIFRRWRPDTSDEIKYLILVSTAGNKQALFTLPLENLCGQIALGVQTLLESADTSSRLISLLIGWGFDSPGVGKHYERFIHLRDKRDISKKLLDDYIESKNIIASMIQRNIDSFQILATHRWKRNQNELAFFVSLIIASLGSMLFASGRHLFSSVFVVLFLSFIGSFFAVFIGDMVEFIKRRADAI